VRNSANVPGVDAQKQPDAAVPEGAGSLAAGVVTAVDVPSLVRLFRCQGRMSQREFAALAGVPRSTIDGLEAGRCEPKLSTLLRLAELAGCRFALVNVRRSDADRMPDGLRLDERREAAHPRCRRPISSAR
jgi:transcriptional regulator with XRE-family HTH domain